MKSTNLSLLLLVVTGTTLIKAAPTSTLPIEIHYLGERQSDRYQFGECFPFNNDGAAMEYVQLASAVQCKWYASDECDGPATSLPLALPLGKVPPSGFALDSTFKGSYKCEKSP